MHEKRKMVASNIQLQTTLQKSVLFLRSSNKVQMIHYAIANQLMYILGQTDPCILQELYIFLHA